MNTNVKTCPICGCEQMKKGKLHGTATLHSLNSRVGAGGSDLIFTFCAECGEVLGIKAANPEKIN